LGLSGGECSSYYGFKGWKMSIIHKSLVKRSLLIGSTTEKVKCEEHELDIRG
jgi:hypothetical protein